VQCPPWNHAIIHNTTRYCVVLPFADLWGPSLTMVTRWHIRSAQSLCDVIPLHLFSEIRRRKGNSGGRCMYTCGTGKSVNCEAVNNARNLRTCDWISCWKQSSHQRKKHKYRHFYIGFA
jgi:hypothetical protein